MRSASTSEMQVDSVPGTYSEAPMASTIPDSRESTGGHIATAVREVRNFIDGRYVGGVGWFEKRSPVDGRLVARIAEAGRGEVDAAVAAARAALRGPWRRMTIAERSELLHRIADGINARF